MQNSKILRYTNMIILTTSANQIIPIIPISQVDLNGNDLILEFTNETTKQVTNIIAIYSECVNDIFYVRNYIVSQLISDFKIRVSQDLGIYESESSQIQILNNLDSITPNVNFSILQENNFYVLKAYFDVSNVIIYKDRVFVTNQSQDSYSINNGQYLTPTIDNNSYITI
jgi:hypothetical protein